MLSLQFEEIKIAPPSRLYFTAFSTKLKNALYSKLKFPHTVGHSLKFSSYWICLSFKEGESSEKMSAKIVSKDILSFSICSCSSQRRIKSSIIARKRLMFRSTVSNIFSYSSGVGDGSNRITWTLACMVVSGVFNSWATLAEKRFCVENDLLSLSNMILKDRHRVPTSSVRWSPLTRSSKLFSVITVICSFSSWIGFSARLVTK